MFGLIANVGLLLWMASPIIAFFSAIGATFAGSFIAFLAFIVSFGFFMWGFFYGSATIEMLVKLQHAM